MPYDPSGEFEPDDDSDDDQYSGYGGFPANSYHVAQVGPYSYVADSNYILVEGSVYNPDGTWEDYNNEPGGGARSNVFGFSDGSLKLQEYRADGSLVTDGFSQESPSGTISSSYVDNNGKAVEYTLNDGSFLRDDTLDTTGSIASYSQINEAAGTSGEVIFVPGKTIPIEYQNTDASGNEGETEYSPDGSLTRYASENSTLTMGTVSEVDTRGDVLGYSVLTGTSDVRYERTSSGAYTDYQQSDANGNTNGYMVDSTGGRTLMAETKDSSGIKVYTSGGLGSDVETFAPAKTDYVAKVEEEGLLGTVLDYTFDSLEKAGSVVEKLDFGADLINQGLERNLATLASQDQSFAALQYTPLAQELDEAEQVTFKELMQNTAEDAHGFLKSVGGIIQIGSVVTAGLQYKQSVSEIGTAADTSKLYNESVKLLLGAGILALEGPVGLALTGAYLAIPTSWKNAAIGYTQQGLNAVVDAAGNAVIDYWTTMSHPANLQSYMTHP